MGKPVPIALGAWAFRAKNISLRNLVVNVRYWTEADEAGFGPPEVLSANDPGRTCAANIVAMRKRRSRSALC